ncbi:MAG: hypothetical protein OET90_04755, partial [Desulfuromonadales bacterium]|nr:hypothetical protein [Desulfuromonadales bacterium]
RLQPFSGRFEVSLVELDVTTFKPYFKDAMAGDVTGLKLSYEAEVDLSPQSIKTKGELTTSAFDLVLNAMPEAPFAQVRFGLSHDLLLDLEKDSLTLNSIAFTLNDNRLEASGAISALSEQPQADLQLNIPTIEVRSLLASLPRKLVVDLAAFDPAGQISGQAKLSGGLEDPVALLQSAQIDLESVQLSVGAMRPALSGTVQLQGEELLAEALTLRAGDNRANIRLTATNLFTPPLIVVADLSAEQLSLDALTGENDAADATADPQEGASSETKAAAQELGPFDIPVHAVGKVRVEQMLWKGLAVDNFTADYELINNRMQLKNVGGAVAGGKVDSALTLDLTRAGLAYSGQLALEGVQADPLLTAFVPAAVGALDGATSLKIDLDGSGTQWSAIKRQLSVRGDLLLSEGYLAAPTLVHGLSGFLHLPQLERIDFDKLQSDVKIVGGKMLIDSMFASESMKFYPKGVVTLDGDIDIALDTRLSPELAAKLDSKGTLSSYLSDQEGWSQLPLLLSGNLSSPHFALDPKGVSKQATKALTGELDRQLDKLLKKDAAPEQDSSDQTQEESQGDSAEELLKKSLRDLFNN